MATARESFSMENLIEIVDNATISAKTKLNQIKQRRSAISIADMFDMQMLMNHLSQLSEMSTAVVNAANSAIVSMARNVKG
ncbi:MAG: type III secretion system needle subunit protein SctF [Oceanospirillaceae bacterium]|nr:type III secretion system needle subunit protein SctF [Oceanospirillaceae bacterium]